MGWDGRQDGLTAARGMFCHKATARPRSKVPPEIRRSSGQAQSPVEALAAHEAEGKMQNEEPRRFRILFEESKRIYSGLYDFPPIGYLTLSPAGTILEANLAVAGMLGVERETLINTYLGRYCAGEASCRLLSHLRRVSLSRRRQNCELVLRAEPGRELQARLESVPWRSDEGVEAFLTSVMDISERKRAEACQLDAKAALQHEIRERKRAQQQAATSQRQLRALSAKLLVAAEDERKRIAREIHDSIGSSLTAIKLFLSNALSHANEGLPVTEELQKTIALTVTTCCEVRRIMADLRPSVLDDFGILAAMRCFCREMLERHPTLDLNLKIDIEEDAVPEALKIVIFRILQEAFHNIHKYSKARSVQVCFGTVDHRIELRVMDDGVGFDLGSASNGSGRRRMGLVGMKERAEFSGGSFAIRSHIGGGTSIHASWPQKLA